jgi:hypothetical protein
MDIVRRRYNVEFPETITQTGALLRTVENSKEALATFTQTFLESIVGFTQGMPHHQTHANLPSLFFQRVDLTIDLENLPPAYAELRKPFSENTRIHHELGIFEGKYQALQIGPAPPYPQSGDLHTVEEIDEYEKEYKAYEREYKKWEKELNTARSKQSPIEQILSGTPYYPHFKKLIPSGIAHIPFPISPELWFSSTWVCAPQGKGKTNLLHNIIKDRREHGTIILMDAKGELINPYLDEAIVIEPSLTNPPPINPLDIGSSIHAVELLEYLFSALLEAKMTPKQSTLFSGVLTLLVIVPNATVETLRQVLQTGWKPYEQYVNRLPRRDKEFFTEGTFDSKGYTATKEEVLWRLQLLLRNPYMAKMLEVPRTRLNMGQLMNSGRIVVINNNPDILGDLGAEFFGRFMLALVWNAVRARANGGSKKPVYFIIDEAQTVIKRDDNIPKLIHQCRSQNVALIFAHQEFNYITSEDVKNALTNCAIKFAAPDGEKAILAPRLRTTYEFLDTMPKHHFAACIRDKETVAVTVPFLKMPSAPPRKDTQNYDLEWEITISPKMALEGGKVKVEHLTVTIPPNTTHGSTLRVKGHGAPKPDGTRGDLYLTVNVPSHPNQRSIGRGPEEIG